MGGWGRERGGRTHILKMECANFHSARPLKFPQLPSACWLDQPSAYFIVIPTLTFAINLVGGAYFLNTPSELSGYSRQNEYLCEGDQTIADICNGQNKI